MNNIEYYNIPNNDKNNNREYIFSFLKILSKSQLILQNYK